MTPRKELFIKIKEALINTGKFELVDLNRNQFSSNRFPEIFTAVLISIKKISYQTMTESNQEGNTSVDVTLFCRDGWMDQHNGTADFEHGLNEIDLLDDIAEALQFLYGEQFKPLQQTDDEEEQQGMEGIFAYRQSFSTLIYRKTNYQYQTKKITL